MKALWKEDLKDTRDATSLSFVYLRKFGDVAATEWKDDDSKQFIAELKNRWVHLLDMDGDSNRICASSVTTIQRVMCALNVHVTWDVLPYFIFDACYDLSNMRDVKKGDKSLWTDTQIVELAWEQINRTRALGPTAAIPSNCHAEENPASRLLRTVTTDLRQWTDSVDAFEADLKQSRGHSTAGSSLPDIPGDDPEAIRLNAAKNSALDSLLMLCAETSPVKELTAKLESVLKGDKEPEELRAELDSAFQGRGF